MTIILGAALAALVGQSWTWATGSAPTSYWQTLGLIVASFLVVDVTEWTLERRHARRQRARRAAVAARWNDPGAPDHMADAR